MKAGRSLKDFPVLLSMTGFGESRYETEQLSVRVELRTVNNRYLKIVTKCPDAYASLEGDIERLVREKVSRGTVNVSIRVEHPQTMADVPLNLAVLKSYVDQLRGAALTLEAPYEPDFNRLATFPGVIDEDSRRESDVEAEWPVLQKVLREASDNLQQFRAQEGRAMQTELMQLAQLIEERLDRVVEQAPRVVEEYRTKILERVRQVVSEAGVSLEASDLIREVSIHADRSDINEEITRLRCHLRQFENFVEDKEPTGRKLDFLSQEMIREVNTIGSKANNVTIAHQVVDMKAAVEKIREILQNVE